MNQPRIPNDILLQRYIEQLSLWEKQTQLSRAKLLQLATYINFEDYPLNMDDTKWSRTIKPKENLPYRLEAVYNLLVALGVFYICNVISEKDIIGFIDTYSIKLPSGMLWELVWENIEKGAQKGKVQFNTFSKNETSTNQTEAKPPKNDSSPIEPKFTSVEVDSTVFKPKLKRSQSALDKKIIFALGIVACILFAIFLLQTKEKPIFACEGPVRESDTKFVSQPGFSLYSLNPNDPQSSILSNKVRTISQDKNGVWVGYGAGSMVSGISYNNGEEKWIHCLGLPLRAKQTVNDIAFYKGDVWVAIDATNDKEAKDDPGIARLTSNGWQFYGKNHGLPSNIVYSLYIDKEGSLWATTYHGIAKLIGERWEAKYDETTDLTCGDVYQILDDSLGRRWVSLIRCGVNYLSKGTWFKELGGDSDPRHNARAMEIDDNGGIWIATAGGGVARFYQNTWVTFVTPQLPSLNVNDVRRDMFGRIWVATDKGVVYSEDYGQTWTPYSTLDTLQIRFGCEGCKFSANHVWFVIHGQGVAHTRIPPKLPTIRIISTPSPVKLKPGEAYNFSVIVQVLAENLQETGDKGDSLQIAEPEGTDLFGTFPIIPVIRDVEQGQTYPFKSTKPIIAPNKLGKYKLSWRVWQGKRFVTEPVVIEFEVVADK